MPQSLFCEPLKNNCIRTQQTKTQTCVLGNLSKPTEGIRFTRCLSPPPGVGKGSGGRGVPHQRKVATLAAVRRIAPERLQRCATSTFSSVQRHHL